MTNVPAFAFAFVLAATVLVDGVPLQEYDPTYIRQEAIGLINQEPVLFAST